MKVLVTGGTGFLGRHLARYLHTLGYEVTVVGRNRAFGDSLAKLGITFQAMDLTDAEPTRRAIQDQAVVFHCAALSSPWGPYKAFYQANVVATRHVIEACRQGQRLIHVSTPSVYYDGSDRLAVRETDPLPRRFANAYAHTKRLAEQLVEQAHQQGLPVISIRPRAIFGPEDQTILPRLIRVNQQTGLPLIRQGQAMMDVTYVDNVVLALVAAMTAPEAEAFGQHINVTNGQPLSFHGLATQLGQAMAMPIRWRPVAWPVAYSAASLMEGMGTLTRREPPLTRYSLGILARSMTLDICRAKTWLNYQPAITLEDGLDRFAHWWKHTHDR